VIATDAIARFMRLDGRDVFFLTGTDEHGIKMVQTAAKEGVAPKELVERNVPRFQAMDDLLNCSYDAFIRTTEPRHHTSSQAIWEAMQRNGDIYLSKYAGWYSVRDEAYYDESETRLDQNDTRLGPQGTPVEWVEEESYFFKLSAYQDKLLKLYADVPDFVLPRERLNEVASFVRGGLNDLSVSRTNFTWGKGKDVNLQFGASYDDILRQIRGYDNSQAWQNAVCGNNPSVFVPSPNLQPPCAGAVLPGMPGYPAYPAYPGYGTGYTAGQSTAVTYQGSLVPNGALPSYLKPGPAGFATVNWPMFAGATNYTGFHNSEPVSGGANTGASAGSSACTPSGSST